MTWDKEKAKTLQQRKRASRRKAKEKRGRSLDAGRGLAASGVAAACKGTADANSMTGRRGASGLQGCPKATCLTSLYPGEVPIRSSRP